VMGKKRVRKFSTWVDAEIAYTAATKRADCQAIALEAIVRGTVKWLPGEQPRKIGLCRLKDQHGGVVILVDRELVGALYLNDWLEMVQTLEAPTGRDYMPAYRSWLDVRRLAAAAKTAQEEARARAASVAEGCQRGGIPPEVNQNIAAY
jgi:hypothetical protein